MTICLNKPTHTYNSSSTGTRGAGPPPCAVQQQQLVVMFSFLLLLLLLYPHFFFVVFLSHARVAEKFREFQLFSDGRQQQQQQPEVFLLTPIHQSTRIKRVLEMLAALKSLLLSDPRQSIVLFHPHHHHHHRRVLFVHDYLFLIAPSIYSSRERVNSGIRRRKQV